MKTNVYDPFTKIPLTLSTMELFGMTKKESVMNKTYTRDEVRKIVSTAIRRTMGGWRDEGPEYRDNAMLQDAYDTGAATVESLVDDYFYEEDNKGE